MGSVSLFIFFVTLLVLARQVSSLRKLATTGTVTAYFQKQIPRRKLGCHSVNNSAVIITIKLLCN